MDKQWFRLWPLECDTGFSILMLLHMEARVNSTFPSQHNIFSKNLKTNIKLTRKKLTKNSSLLPIAVYATRVRAEECGAEELNKCSKSLQILRSATELSFTPKQEELAELCPDLQAGLRCISSYTRRCMTLPQRQQFMKIYKGTNEVIRELCREGDFQNEFLKHASCLQSVKPQHKKCEERYQETISSLQTPRVNHTAQSEQQTEQNTNDDVKKVCW